MNLPEIMAMLPHRYPFLLVDRVIEIVPGERILALKNVTANEPQFQGHFPSLAIMPGVLLVEAIAQCAGILAISAHPEMKGHLFYLTGLDGFRFRKPVIPGDSVRIHVERIAVRRSLWQFEARAEVDGKRVVDGKVLGTMAAG